MFFDFDAVWANRPSICAGYAGPTVGVSPGNCFSTVSFICLGTTGNPCLDTSPAEKQNILLLKPETAVVLGKPKAFVS